MSVRAKVIVAFVIGVATMPLLIVIAAWLGLLPVAATNAPPRWERRLAGRALDTSLNRSAKELKVPIADDDQTLLAGLKVYRNNCAGCHGDFAAPSQWGSKNFYPRVPQFSERAPNMPVPEMFVVIKNGIRYSGMGAWQGMMSDEDMWRVALFLGRLKALPSAVDEAWRKPAK